LPDGSNNSSFLANLFHQHDDTATEQITPVIGLAISRDTSGVNNAGTLIFGGSTIGLVVMINATIDTTIPISTSSFSGSGYVFNDTSMQYAITVSSLAAQNATFNFNTLLTNGTNSTSSTHSTNSTSPFPEKFYLSTSDTVISLAPDLAAQINGMFDPPAIPSGDNQTYYVQCNAIAPDLSLTINNTTFAINPLDLQRHASNGLCISTITANLDGQYVLGDAFLRNVFVVLDFRTKVMHLGSRPYYES
jgi:hypothetical protein